MKFLQTIQNALAHAVTKTPKHHHCPKITALAKSPSMHPLQNCISYLHSSNLLTFLIHQLLTIQPPGSTRSSSYLSLSRAPVSSSLKFCNRSIAYAAPALWNGLPKDLRQFAHPPPPLNLTVLRLHSPSLLSTHDWRLQAVLSRFYFCAMTRLGMYRVQFFTEYRVLRWFFTGSGYRVPGI